MWELDHKECSAPENFCFQTVVLKKTLESPLDSKEIRPANPKENQPQIFIAKTDAEAEYFSILYNILLYPMPILIEIGTSLL